MRVASWLTFIFLGIIVISVVAAPSPSSTKTSTYRSVDTSCSVPAVSMPEMANPTSLKQCEAAVRAYMKAMIANVRVTATCRQQFIERTGPHLPSAETVRRTSRELLKLIPELERGAEQQLRQKSTLAQCKKHLESAHQLVILQPELRGEWLPSTTRR